MASHHSISIWLPAKCLAVSVGVVFSAPAYAQLPEAAKQMITNAAREGVKAELATIVKFARKTYPNEGIEIDTLLLSLENPATEAAVAAPAAATPPPAQPTSPPPVVKWSGKGDLGGFHTSGNTDSFGITVGANLMHKSPQFSHQLRLRGDYQESDGTKSREYLNGAYQVDWAISEKNYALSILEYERDVLAGINHRSTSSLGAGWRVISDNEVALALEAGPAFRHEWYRDGGENSNLAARGALTSSWQMNDKVRLSHNMELVAQEENNTIRTITGLQAKLTSRISSQISYDLRYQDKPLFGKEETDTITRIGLTYDF